MPPAKHYDRRRRLAKARKAVEASIKSQTSMLLARAWKGLKPVVEKRKAGNGNFGVRGDGPKLLKADGDIPSSDWDGWDDWSQLFEATLTETLLEGIGVFGDTEAAWADAAGYSGVIFDPRQILTHYQNRIGREISDIADTTRQDVASRIASWYQSGQSLDSLISQLEDYFLQPWRAEMIAITETTGIASEIARELMEQIGSESWVWNSRNDYLVCDECAELHGQTFGIDDEMPPLHPNCVLPGNKVVAPDILAATKSFYSGPVVELRTSGGSRLSVTENHPVLTTHGWIRAKFLCKSDKIVCTADIQRIMQTINPNYYNMPIAIEEIFSALKESSSMNTASVPTTSEDFHGDARFFDGNIEIVYSNCFLLGNNKIALAQPISKNILSYRNVGQGFLGCYGMGNFLFNAPFPSTSNFMGGSDLFLSLFDGHILPLDQFGLALSPSLYPLLSQDSPDNFSINPKLARQFVLRFAGQISCDQIVSIRNYNYSGHVYDLQCHKYQLYTIDNLIVSNCRCGQSINLPGGGSEEIDENE